MFGRKRKEPEECVVCQGPAFLTINKNNLDPRTAPLVMTINQHKHPEAEIPFSIYLCAECADIVSGFVVYLMEEREKKEKEQALMDKLSKLNVGTVLTVIEEHPHAMPNEEMKRMLADTPFNGIWNQEL